MKILRLENILITILFATLLVLFIGFSLAFSSTVCPFNLKKMEVGGKPFDKRTTPYYLLFDSQLEKDDDRLIANYFYNPESQHKIWVEIEVFDGVLRGQKSESKLTLRFPLKMLAVDGENSNLNQRMYNSELSDCSEYIYYKYGYEQVNCGCVTMEGVVVPILSEGCFLHTTWHYEEKSKGPIPAKKLQYHSVLLVVPY